MRPYHKADGITLYHGDALDVLPTLLPKRFGLVVTDPPYGVDYATNRRVSKADPLRGLHLANDRDRADDLLRQVLRTLWDIATPEAVLYCFASPRRLDKTMPIVREWGGIVNVLCWDKGNGTAGDLRGAYGAQWEAILFARRQRTLLLGARDRDVLRFSRGSGANYDHPTQKPLDLLRYLISKHDAPHVLDPFAGAGTTLVAAKLEGRQAVGVEIEERYCEAAARRLDALPATS